MIEQPVVRQPQVADVPPAKPAIPKADNAVRLAVFGDSLANDLAKQVALKGAKTAEELLAQPFVGDASKKVSDRIQDVFGVIRENMKPARMQQFKGLVGSYVHHDGTTGAMVLVEGEKAEAQMLRDVCMHITATKPRFDPRRRRCASMTAAWSALISGIIIGTSGVQRWAELLEMTGVSARA